MTYIIPKSIQYAQSQVGVVEVPWGSNCQGYSDWQYGVRCPGGGWCISFASKVTVEGGYRFEGATHGERGFSFTGAAEAWARSKGLWRDKNWRAKPGDWGIFQWDGGQTDHGEVVYEDDGAWIVFIGGNTSNAVKYRKRDRHFIVGFVAFSESDQVAAPPPPPPKVRPMFDPNLKLAARLQHPDGGWWTAYDGGRVDFLPPVPGQAALTGGLISGADLLKTYDTQGVKKHVSRLERRDYTRDGVLHHGYVVVFTDGSSATPSAQKNT